MIYKIMIDSNHENFNKFFRYLEKEDLEFCFSEEWFYVYTDYTKPRYIDMIMKKAGISNFFYQEIKNKPQRNEGNFIMDWIRNKMEEEELKTFENEHQEELRQMVENIQRVQELVNSLNNNNQEGEDGNNSNRETSEGTPKED